MEKKSGNKEVKGNFFSVLSKKSQDKLAEIAVQIRNSELAERETAETA